jgi:hypothetical protein
LIAIGLAALAVSSVLALIAFHFFYMPLDTLWYVLMRKLRL